MKSLTVIVCTIFVLFQYVMFLFSVLLLIFPLRKLTMVLGYYKLNQKNMVTIVKPW